MAGVVLSLRLLTGTPPPASRASRPEQFLQVLLRGGPPGVPDGQPPLFFPAEQTVREDANVAR